MKKVFVIFIAVSLLLMGCSPESASIKWHPHHVSENIKPYAEKALHLVEQYLSFEITLKDFYEGISSVYDRLDFEDREANNAADSAVWSAILDLRYDYDEFNDNTFRMYRDMLRFQLGEISEGTYPPLKKIFYDFDEDWNSDKAVQIGKRLNLQDLPVHHASVLTYNVYPTISLTFDFINGVMPEDVFSHCNALIEAVQKEEVCIDSLMIYYDIYGQLAFVVDVMSDDAGEYMISLVLDLHTTKEKEYLPIADENVQRMIASASSYVSDFIK